MTFHRTVVLQNVYKSNNLEIYTLELGSLEQIHPSFIASLMLIISHECKAVDL